MKKIFTITLALLLLLSVTSCEEEKTTKSACEVENPTVDLPWLADIISKAENDQTGNYIGKIWIKSYQGQDYVVTNMALGSGGLKFHCFDCSGALNPINDIAFYNALTDREIVFSNVK